jgi:radical S-adenosyl methionine domain-containing protein 2
MAPSTLIPITVNMHILRECNYRCRGCFAGFPNVDARLSAESAKRLIDRLVDSPPILGRYKVTKVTFAGGEPTLHPELPELLAHAHGLGLTTCIVTNAHRLSRDQGLRGRLGPALVWLAVSLDGPTEAINQAYGRGNGDALARVREAVRSMRAEFPCIRLKVNTVVMALNWDTSMVDVIAELAPERWKVLQVTRLEGENDDTHSQLAVTPEQFDHFVSRHSEALPPGLTMVPEREGQVQGSYLMVDPDGHLFANVGGRMIRGPSLLTTSLDHAAQLVSWDPAAFVARGGAYDWGATD